MKWIQTTKRGYKFDKRLFWVYTLIILGYCIYLMSLYDFNFEKQLYLNCPFDPAFPYRQCTNPIIGSNLAESCHEDWCKQPTLPPGEYGKKIPQEMFSNFAMSIWGGVLIILLLNHFIHNRGKRFDIELVVWKDKVINLDTLKNVKLEEEKDESDKDSSVK